MVLCYFSRRNNIVGFFGLIDVRGSESGARVIVVWLKGDNIFQFMEKIGILNLWFKGKRMDGVF